MDEWKPVLVRGDAPAAIGGGWDATLVPDAIVCVRCMKPYGIHSGACLRRACLWNHDPGDEDRR
jgi:hypothetical protein